MAGGSWNQYYHKLAEEYYDDIVENRNKYYKNKPLCKILNSNRMALGESWSVIRNKRSKDKLIRSDSSDTIPEGDRFSYGKFV